MKILKEDDNNLLMLSVRGFSQEESTGVPVLRIKPQATNSLSNGILELDFLMKPIEVLKKKSIEFHLNVVFNLNQLPIPLVGIKIIAQYNADIILV